MDGTKGQVLTKQSETNGDANWEDIEANEVFVGNEEEAPNSAKIIVEEDDFVEGSTLSKAEVYIGAEEPTTGEKVWFRKGKNYLDISKLKSRTSYGITFTPTDTGIKISGTATDTYAYGDSIKFDLEKGKTYTLYGNNAGNTLKLELKNNKTIFMSIKTTENKVTFTPSKNVESITFVLEGIAKGTTYDYEISNLQIEPGSKATSYEAYIEPQIFVRNSNGVYEEFAKKSEEVYSTEEQRIGTWIDGKPLYRKVINAKPTISNSSYQTISIKHNISDLKNVYKCNAFLHNTGNTQTYILPVETSATQAIGISEINSTNIIMYSKNDTWSGWIAEIILEYTKTTD